MARGTTLGNIVKLVREESSETANAAFGQATAETVRTQIRRTYRRLHADWNWPHLKITRDKTLSAGSRYYTLEADLDPDRLLEVWTKQAGTTLWLPVAYGIDPSLYNKNDPADDERADPVKAWAFFEGGQYEVWPLPATASVMRFIGISKAKALTEDNHTCDLDDNLIALYVAAERLAKQKSSDAQLKLDQANALYLRLKGNGQRSGSFPIQSKRSARTGVTVRAPGT